MQKRRAIKSIMSICLIVVLLGSTYLSVVAGEDMSEAESSSEQIMVQQEGEELQQTDQEEIQESENEQETFVNEEKQDDLNQDEEIQDEINSDEVMQDETEQVIEPQESQSEENETEETSEMGETEEENDGIDHKQIQQTFNQQMAALMSLGEIEGIAALNVAQGIKDIYPQYVNYNDEMEGISVEKAWSGDAQYNRPEVITLDLYLDDQVIDSLTLTADDDWKGSFTNHYPAYKLDENGEYVLDENGEKVPLDYVVKEREVTNYVPSYTSETHKTTVDTASVHLFVPATEVRAGEQYLIVSSNQIGQQKIYRAEASQTEDMITSAITISDENIKDKDGNIYNNYILMQDGDGSYGGLLWNAYDTGSGSFYMFSNMNELWGQSHGVLEMGSTQDKTKCPHVSELGIGSNLADQGFYKVGNDENSNAYKTESSSENLYFYKEVELPDGAFNTWQMETFVSNRYDPAITVDPGSEAASAKTDMTVTKKWENDSEDERPEEILVHLYANGEDTGKTIYLNKENQWSAQFEDLDIYKDGKAISYSVVEEVPQGYSAEYQYDNVSSTGNTSGITQGSQTKGYWVRTNRMVDGETYLIVTSPNSGNVTGMEIDQDGKGFSWTNGGGHAAGTVNVEGPITINGQTYATHITQEEAESHTRMQWTAKAAGASTANQVGYHNWFVLESVSNPGCYPKFNGEGDISDGTANESKLYYGLQYTTGSGGQNGYVALDEKGNKQNRTPTVKDYPNDFSYVFGAANDYFLLTNNHTGDANAMTAQTFYLYKFIPVSGPSAVITNSKSETTSLKVYKNWSDKGHEAERPDSIQIELLKNGKETGQTITLSAKNNWMYTFDDLPKVDERGKQITYSAKEKNLPDGYTGSVVTGTVGGSEEKVTYSYAWVPVTKMEDGKEYILADNIQGSATTLGVSGGKATLKGQTITITSNETLTDENGNHHSAYITDEEAAKVTKWKAHANGNYTTLEYNGGYFQKGSGDLKTKDNEKTKLQYDDGSHALKNDKGQYMSSNGDFNGNSPQIKTYLYERVRIKNVTTIDTTQDVTTITNTYKEQNTDFILQKLDGTSGKKLSGNYQFTLMDSSERIVDHYENRTVDSNGQIHFQNLPYGDYILEETKAEDAYGKLPETLKLTLSEKGIQVNNKDNLSAWIEVSENAEGIHIVNIKNYKLINMPETGSNGRQRMMALGMWLLIGGTLLMINNKKRGVINKKQ